VNHDEIVDKVSKILELANSAYQCLTHKRVIRGDGGSWVTDIDEVWTLSQELVRSQRIWFAARISWRNTMTKSSGTTTVEVQSRNEAEAGEWALMKLKEKQSFDEAVVEEIKAI
jgi:hypothetical protein